MKKMKKMMTGVLALLMVLSMAACGEDTPAVSTKPQKPGATSAAENKDRPQKPAQTEGKQDSGNAEIPSGYINQEGRLAESGVLYFSYPEGYGYRQDSIIHQIFKDDVSLVAVCFGRKGDGSTPEDILHVFDSSFGEGVGTVSKGYLRRSKIEIISHEPAMVNEWKAEKFIGKIPNVTSEKTWDCHVAGYLFTVEDVSVMVTSLVSDMAQDPEVIANADALMEDIAKTIRIGE